MKPTATMSLVNNALTTPPVNRSPHKVTLGSIGLTTRAIQMSATNNPEGLNPDAFNMMMENNSLEAWWICLPTEIHQSALCPTTNRLLGISGNILMPEFDKAIWSTDPGAAVTTCAYHATELHLESANHHTWMLTCVVVNKLKQLQRLGNNTVDIFNRGYVRPQLQIQAGNVMRFTVDEQVSTQIWEVTSSRDNTVLHQVTTELSWSNNYMWTYNYVFPTSLISAENNDHFICFLQSLEYSGATVLQQLSTDETVRLWGLLSTPQNWRHLQQISMGGNKTMERLRGNARVIEWITANTNMEQFVAKYNQYRNSSNPENREDDEDMPHNIEDSVEARDG